ncbi:hypothetical protein U1Q18_023481 [Sarracenia purpurea var. burkii]
MVVAPLPPLVEFSFPFIGSSLSDASITSPPNSVIPYASFPICAALDNSSHYTSNSNPQNETVPYPLPQILLHAPSPPDNTPTTPASQNTQLPTPKPPLDKSRPSNLNFKYRNQPSYLLDVKHHDSTLNHLPCSNSPTPSPVLLPQNNSKQPSSTNRSPPNNSTTQNNSYPDFVPLPYNIPSNSIISVAPKHPQLPDKIPSNPEYPNNSLSTLPKIALK